MEGGMELNKADGLSVVCLAFCAALASELVSFLVFFHKQSFRDATKEIIELGRKCHKQRVQDGSSYGGLKGGRAEKKLLNLEKDLAKKNRAIGLTRQKANIMSGVAFIVLMPWVYGMYEGLVVAKLPLEPIFPFRLMSHATLRGDDFTDCSFTFLFTTTMFLVKTTIQKLLGYAPTGGIQTKTDHATGGGAAGLFATGGPATTAS